MVDTKDIKTIVLKYFKEENISSIKEIADKLIITINKDEDKQSKNKLLDELTLYFPSLKTTVAGIQPLKTVCHNEIKTIITANNKIGTKLQK